MSDPLPPLGHPASPGLRQRLQDGLNRALMINLFFVLASFGWFAVAVVGQAADLPLGLEAWYALWLPLFQPAIGLLMAGALVSGAIGWVRRRWPGSGSGGG